MRFLVLVILLWAATANAEDKRVLADHISDNRKVQLVAAKISIRRGQNLDAKFIELGSQSNQEFVVTFPSHSHTTYEVTLMSIIDSCVDWKAPMDPYTWHDATCDVAFSVPKDAGGYHGDSEHYDHWFLLSIKIPPQSNQHVSEEVPLSIVRRVPTALQSLKPGMTPTEVLHVLDLADYPEGTVGSGSPSDYGFTLPLRTNCFVTLRYDRTKQPPSFNKGELFGEGWQDLHK